MQISKTFLAVCVALGLLPLSIRAADTDAQAKARKALEEKLKELEGQSPPPTQDATPPQQAKPQPPPTTPPPQTQATTPVPPPQEQIPPPLSDAEKARAAVRQKLEELQRNEPQTPVTPAPAVAQPETKSTPQTAAPPPAVAKPSQ